MEISLMHQGLLIKGKQCTLAIDPFKEDGKIDLETNKPNCVLITSALFEAGQKKDEDQKVFSWPGEFEVKGVPITSKYEYGEDQVSEGARKLLFHLTVDGFKICYLPELTKELHSDLIEAIGDLDLLIMPMIKDQKILTNTLEEIEPKAVLGLDTTQDPALKEQFMKVFGLSSVEEKPLIKINAKSDLSTDKTDLFLLARS
jgi:hypothetical protein